MLESVEPLPSTAGDDGAKAGALVSGGAGDTSSEAWPCDDLLRARTAGSLIDLQDRVLCVRRIVGILCHDIDVVVCGRGQS